VGEESRPGALRGVKDTPAREMGLREGAEGRRSDRTPLRSRFELGHGRLRGAGIAASILALLASVGLIQLFSASAARAESPSDAVPEYALKATFLTRLGAFVTWPASPSTLGICVLGRDPFGTYLDAAAAANPSERPIRVRRIDETGEVSGCNVLFVSERRARSFEEIRDVLCEHHVLTVSDHEDFLENGGMIGFIRTGDHVQLHINRAEVERVGLRVSSELLQIARVRSNAHACPVAPPVEQVSGDER
jgi:hypothetical protein